MIISYNWLSEYLPKIIEPEKLSKILTSIGLEVESLHKYEAVKGGLQGLVIGEVLTCEKHPDADKLKLTTVNIGAEEKLQIVCGAHNVAAGQKVVVATIGTTIYPFNGEPMTMKKAKIRGVESQGMICAEDEIGLGESHAGIMVLPHDTVAGTLLSDFFNLTDDHIFEIGLTPNRSDAMSHLGVARDVCAYLSHHNKKEKVVRSPFKNNFKPDNQGLQMEVVIENTDACQRYAGVSIEGVTIADSPDWLQQKLKSIGLRPINNIVDITNFILHETGQPLHAFDADAITGKKVIVKNLPEGTPFVTLDEKERKLFAEDLMICNADAPMCIGGVYGGMHSGVSATTKNIFLESAWFNPVNIRKTSLKHGLRTDAATRFEKGVDISNTVHVLKRAATLIKEIAGGQIASDIIDVYPNPKEKTEVALKYHYLKKLSGKNYHGDTIKNILHSLGFELIKEGDDEMRYKVPFSKTDISIGADIVEEIMRIDGLDNVDIPAMITIAPAVETLAHEATYTEKVAEYLAGSGFQEIFTNSITNSAYYDDVVLQHTVKMINNLSEELNVMRPAMMETGLTSIAYNLNRKNNDLKFFEFGKTYAVNEAGKYIEDNHLTIYITGNKTAGGWKGKTEKADFYFLKAVFEKIMNTLGLKADAYAEAENLDLTNALQATIKNQKVAEIGLVSNSKLDRFDIKQPVFYADLNWDRLLKLNKKINIQHQDVSKYPAVNRDLAIIVNKALPFEAVEKATAAAKVNKLTSISLFDIFESEKIGAGKKSMAISFTFLDEEKTMTDKDIDSMMNKIIGAYEKELGAEIRKAP
ncbi:MAG: phenylalanine--tRNA ligase subunit beta [Chitinophagaceae bacterium]|nr:phenylalanine--tRNA ligase subunit beta [Chitinophagaceae bacterium]